jgi:hypothetical protein
MGDGVLDLTAESSAMVSIVTNEARFDSPTCPARKYIAHVAMN